MHTANPFHMEITGVCQWAMSVATRYSPYPMNYEGRYCQAPISVYSVFPLWLSDRPRRRWCSRARFMSTGLYMDNRVNHNIHGVFEAAWLCLFRLPPQLFLHTDVALGHSHCWSISERSIRLTMPSMAQFYQRT